MTETSTTAQTFAPWQPDTEDSGLAEYGWYLSQCARAGQLAMDQFPEALRRLGSWKVER